MQWAGVGMWMVLGLSACSPTKTEIGNLNVIPQPQEVSQDIQAHPFVINPQTGIVYPEGKMCIRDRNKTMDMNLILASIGVFLGIILLLVVILLVAKQYLTPVSYTHLHCNDNFTSVRCDLF